MRVFGLIFSLFLLCFATLAGAEAVFAAANTSTDTNPGQVQTAKSEDGTIYLTTQVNENGSNESNRPANRDTTSNRTSSSTTNIMGEPIRLHQGFASDLGSYINSLLNIIIIVCLLLVFLSFIQAGLQWITSGGDKGKTEDARNRIVHAFIGILIVSSSFALVGFVAYILGFDSVNDALTNVSRINPA